VVIFNDTLTASEVEEGPTIEPAMYGDEIGVFQTEEIDGAISAQLQGRLDATMSWIDIGAAHTANNMTTNVPIVPQMRVQVTEQVAAAAEAKCLLML
jgi:hypothetical protein